MFAGLSMRARIFEVVSTHTMMPEDVFRLAMVYLFDREAVAGGLISHLIFSLSSLSMQAG